MKQRLLLLTALTALFLFTGCVKINLHQTIDSDGNTQFQMKIDMSAMSEYGESMAATGNQTTEEPDLCENFSSTNNLTQYFDEVNCESEGYVATITGKKTLTTQDGFKAESTLLENNYEFNASKMFKELNMTGGPSSLGTDSPYGDSYDPAMAKNIGMEYTYTLEMPAEIIKAEGGEINGSTVTYDLLERPLNQHQIYVQAKGTNPNLIYIGIGVAALVVLVIIIIIVVVLLKRRGEKPPKSKEQPKQTGKERETPSKKSAQPTPTQEKKEPEPEFDSF